ncbi:MAG: dynamin family protein [Opitutaceae bacterium]
MAEPAIALNENHRRSLLAGFKYMDRLLAEALAELANEPNGAIFSRTRPDATPVQRRVAADYAARLRAAMRHVLGRCALPPPDPEVGAVWNLRSYLISLDIALEEMTPERLRGYGPLDERSGDALRSAQAELHALVAELQAYLASGLGGDLATRLARLDGTSDEVRLVRELERITTAHGLTEFRPAVGELLGRLERNVWTLAFVGRVSSGKSSLLNHALGADLLPSGVTPVTAVPIRVMGGDPSATVSFATEKPVSIPIEELARYASEEGNPGNRRHVTDLLLHWPADCLAGGEICFVDTPGLGSLATSGGAQTYAFLPRCDLGVLLVDASATLNGEDLEVLRKLMEGGAETLIVLSKADLLPPADREKLLAYLREKTAETLGREVPAAAVSVAPGHATLADAWLERTLKPRQARHRELAQCAFRRKIGALKDGVAGALAVRLDGAGAAATADLAAFGTARAELVKAERRMYEWIGAETLDCGTLIDAVAGGVEAADRRDPAESAAIELARAASDLGGRLEALLRETRAAALRALDGAGLDVLPEPAGRPLFDPAPVVWDRPLSTAWERWPLASARRAALRRQLRSRWADALDEALRAHGQALIRWGRDYLGEIATALDLRKGFAEAAAGPNPSLTIRKDATERDLEILRRWDRAPPVPAGGAR